MGLSIVIAGGIMLFTMVQLMMIIPNLLDYTNATNTATLEMSKIENSISDTEVRIIGLTAFAGSDQIDITLANNGTTKLWNYDKFNLILTYDSDVLGIKTRRTELLTYHQTCVIISGEWCINQFVNDLQDPRILNEDEALKITGKLQYPIYPNGLLISSISTDNGVVSNESRVVT